ncbi:MAG: HAD family hydrolase [Elusimicrobiota bacterium]
MKGKWAIFLDRDGTISGDAGLVSVPEQLRLLPGAGAALRRLREAGALLIVVTNQPVVARDLVDEEGLGRIHRRLEELLAGEGASLDAIYYCPHHPETHHPEAADPRYRRVCGCRKPKPGMLLAAAERFGVDLARSFMVGDSTRDVGAARAAGCRAVLVRTGSGGADGTCPDARPDATVDDLAGAADWILRNRE